MRFLSPANACVAAAVLAGALAQPSKTEWVRVPGRALMHHSCVHEVPSGSKLGTDEATRELVVEMAGEEHSRIPPCSFPPRAHQDDVEGGREGSPQHGPAWKAWTEALTKGPAEVITRLTGTWEVPANPADLGLGMLLYLWNGIEPADNTVVLQPVLQWGGSPAGGGQYWALASWFVDNTGRSIHTPLMTVAAGDKVLGEVTRQPDGSYVVVGRANGKDVSITRNVTGDKPYVYACNTMESIVDTCSEYPSTVFNVTDIAWSTSSSLTKLKWTPLAASQTYCKEHATSAGPDTTVIHWNGL